MNLAPVIIFTFNRLEHTQKTIEALKKNLLAEETDVFIFSDGARNESEKVNVNLVRKYIKSIDGFKSIKIIESEKNKGLATSVIDGVSNIIEKYNKVIILEDDIITCEYFLEYMNEALNLYKDRKDIWSISGYSPNIKFPNDYYDDVYLVRRGSSWGWGTWKERWNLVDWNISDYNDFKNDRMKKKEFNKSGTDLVPMLDDQMNGRIDSWAIRWVYNQYKYDLWTIFPRKSLVKNNGTDLSGTHSSITNKYDVELLDRKLNLNIDIKKNNKIIKNFKKFYNLSLIGYIAILIKKMGLYRPARNLRNYLWKLLKK